MLKNRMVDRNWLGTKDKFSRPSRCLPKQFCRREIYSLTDLLTTFPGRKNSKKKFATPHLSLSLLFFFFTLSHSLYCYFSSLHLFSLSLWLLFPASFLKQSRTDKPVMQMSACMCLRLTMRSARTEYSHLGQARPGDSCSNKTS